MTGTEACYTSGFRINGRTGVSACLGVRRKIETVNVTYHPEKGYPLTIYIDVSTMMADEEQGYTVEELVGR